MLLFLFLGSFSQFVISNSTIEKAHDDFLCALHAWDDVTCGQARMRKLT